MPTRVTMRYAFIKDPHFRFGLSKPVGRTDNFHDEIMDKLAFLVGYCVENDIPNIVTTGDILDIKAPSLYDFKAVKEISDVLTDIKDSGITLMSIAGNHDLPSSSIDKKEDSVYQYFVDHGLIVDIESSNLDEICGLDYRPKLDTLFQWLEEAPLKEIIVVHEHLFPTKEDYTGFGTYTYYQNVADAINSNKNSKCKYVVAGHLHKGFATQEVDGITFINPWSFTRLARDSYAVNNDHKPQFVVLDTDTGKVETIEIPHKPFSEAFIEAEVKRNLNLDVTIKEFISKLNDFSNDGNIDNLLEGVELEGEVRAKVKYYIEKAGA